ncbi:hypothetical protein RchiOBHm_Chr4g0388571 [Rosa chinensis]|uniref:Uncharacterized protein n=1 Tax=Rosa chinensis TaxID=74649 RepID=A0A2P6QPV6_ROSCH|nr:hypothetical protein RchiOBHm_Chr4g0388571 [Rosa chinensis]
MVRVPVLSVQIVVADPMVSQAESFRTIALSTIILFMEYARVRVTANGRPSGIATTTIVTAAATIPMTAFVMSSDLVLLPLYSLFPLSSSVFPVKYLTNMTTRTKKATAKPTLPIEEVSLSRRACRGVFSLVSWLIWLIISPQFVFIPTDVTSIRP